MARRLIAERWQWIGDGVQGCEQLVVLADRSEFSVANNELRAGERLHPVQDLRVERKSPARLDGTDDVVDLLLDLLAGSLPGRPGAPCARANEAEHQREQGQQ